MSDVTLNVVTTPAGEPSVSGAVWNEEIYKALTRDWNDDGQTREGPSQFVQSETGRKQSRLKT